jgi:hypothetical protein
MEETEGPPVPNATGRAALRERRNARAAITDKETITVTTTEAPVSETNEVPDFTSLITAAPEDYKPDRSPAGRKRTPSQFEAVLPGLKDQGWQRIEHDGTVVMKQTESGQLKADPKSVKDSNAHVIRRELQKAQHFLKLGMDLNITETHVEFRVRDLQKRETQKAEEEYERELSGEADEADEVEDE